MATILTKKSDTASAVPATGDLTHSSGGAELAVNTADKRLFTKNSGGTVVEVGTNPSTLTTATLSVTGNSTLGDASGDSVTINASTVSTPNGLNFDSNTLVIDATNNRVGVGTASPDRKLTVVTPAAGASVGSNAVVFSDFANATMELKQSTTENQWYSNTALSLAAGGAERMRIDSSGNLLVGKTSQSALVVGGEIRPSGVFVCTNSATVNTTSTWDTYSTGASAYRFYVGYGGTVYATNTTISAISDQRYKENIRDLDVGLDAVMQLRPRKFDWKEGKGQDTKDCRGFIAQEFEQVFPDLIDTWKDPAPEGEEPYKSVRQDLIPVLVKAIQELKAELDSVKTDLATLKGN